MIEAVFPERKPAAGGHAFQTGARWRERTGSTNSWLKEGLFRAGEGKGLIMEGKVTVEGNVIDKAGTSVDTAAEIQLRGRIPLMSAEGQKAGGSPG